jgi:hypothetical protein
MMKYFDHILISIALIVIIVSAFIIGFMGAKL